jgi:cytochrome c biogenesis protein CcmG/thiol:disulfide interchange protein DsbE
VKAFFYAANEYRMGFVRSVVSVFILLSFISLRTADAVAKVDLPIAPNFELTRADGQLFKLHDYAGKPVIVHFWATWCPYCKNVNPVKKNCYLNINIQTCR